MYLVHIKHETESMRSEYWKQFATAEALERWLTYDKGFLIVLGVYKAERVQVEAITQQVHQVVGYKVKEEDFGKG